MKVHNFQAKVIFKSYTHSYVIFVDVVVVAVDLRFFVDMITLPLNFIEKLSNISSTFDSDN